MTSQDEHPRHGCSPGASGPDLPAGVTFPSLDTVFAAMQEGLSVLDPSGVHIDVNPALCTMTGFSREELLGQGPPHPYWPPEVYESISRAFDQTLQGEHGPFELLFMKKDGTRFQVQVSPSPVHDRAGRLTAYMATVKDITGQRQADDYLHLLARMADDAPASITVHDFSGTVLYANEETFRLHGYPREEFLA